MISFFREHAEKFVWLIVITFLATLFAGSVFSTLSNRKTQKETRVASQSSVAYFGESPVDTRRYYFFVEQMISGFRRPFRSITPEILDLVQFDAFTKALHYSVLREGAMSANTDLSRLEKEKIVNKAVVDFDLIDKKDLKRALKERGIDYKQFIAYQEENYLVQRFTSSLESGISVSDADVDRKYMEVNASHILIPIPQGEEGRAQAEDYMISLQESVEKGVPFAELAKEHSRDTNTKENGGKLGWIRYGQTVPAFENALYSLEVGELSDPVETEFGFHLVKVTERRELNRPLDIDYDKEKQAILALKREQAVKTYLSTQLRDKEIRFEDPFLAGYDARLRGNVDAAVGAYQSLGSQQPSSPIPNYLLAKVYLESGQLEKAQQMFEQGAVKIELNPQTGFSQFFIEWAKIINAQSKRKALYEKALDAAVEDYTSQEVLAQYFTDIKQPKYLSRVQKMKSDLDQKVLALQEAAKAESAAPPTSEAADK